MPEGAQGGLVNALLARIARSRSDLRIAAASFFISTHYITMRELYDQAQNIPHCSAGFILLSNVV